MDGLEASFAPSAAPGAAPNILFTLPVPLGRDFETRYIHSLQLSPVEDSYRVREGRIRAWRERVMSHNAGLPSLSPPRGRFIMAPPWMIVEGGGASWPEIAVRIGDERFGRNEIRRAGGEWIALWRQFPGRKLLLRAVRLPLCAFFYLPPA